MPFEDWNDGHKGDTNYFHSTTRGKAVQMSVLYMVKMVETASLPCRTHCSSLRKVACLASLVVTQVPLRRDLSRRRPPDRVGGSCAVERCKIARQICVQLMWECVVTSVI